MSNTDNAFVKAYADELAMALGRPAKQVGRRAVDPRGQGASPAVPAAPMSVSGPYTSSYAYQQTANETVSAAPVAPLEERFPREASPVEEVVSASVSRSQSSLHAIGSNGDVRRQRPEVTNPSADAEVQSRFDSAVFMVSPPPHANFQQTVGATTTSLSPDDYPLGLVHDTPAERDSSSRIITAPTSASPTFRPLWEVDRFRWPTLVDHILDSYSDELIHITAQLADQSKRGRKVVAITSFARREGRTVLALTLARLAAQRGMSITLVDGDYDNPQIAGQLGIAFEKGWDDMGDSPPPISEVAVQSIEDNLSILPLRENGHHRGLSGKGRACAALATLAEANDVVLLDAGPMFTAAHRWFDRQTCSSIHCALLVRDVRGTTETQLTDVVERLTSRDIHVMGIAENFELTLSNERATTSPPA